MRNDRKDVLVLADPKSAEVHRKTINIRLQVFQPRDCQFHPWSSEHFNTCFAGRRLVMIGDSLMRQTFQSLGCLLRSSTVEANAGVWGPKTSKVLGTLCRPTPMDLDE
jgi:hypothetical protein